MITPALGAPHDFNNSGLGGCRREAIQRSQSTLGTRIAAILGEQRSALFQGLVSPRGIDLMSVFEFATRT